MIFFVIPQQHHPGYASGPQNIWPLFCNGNSLGNEDSTDWCFDAATNMSYARYSTTDRWRWVDGCVHEHVRRNPPPIFLEPLFAKLS